jgi:hypothetical protein
MKKILFLSALTSLITLSAFAQVPTSATFPPNQLLIQRLNTQNYTQLTPTYYHGAGTNAIVGHDTLMGVDTIAMFWQFGAPYNLKLSIKTNVLTDSLVGHIYAFASEDNVTWQAVTGITTVCTTCVGASQTLSATTGVHRYVYDLGNTNFPYWRVWVTSSGAPDTVVCTGVGIYAGTGN